MPITRNVTGKEPLILRIIGFLVVILLNLITTQSGDLLMTREGDYLEWR